MLFVTILKIILIFARQKQLSMIKENLETVVNDNEFVVRESLGGDTTQCLSNVRSFVV